MAVQHQQSYSNKSIMDLGLRFMIDAHTTEADLQELMALAHEHLDENVLNNPDALLAILNRVSRLAKQNERTQTQIIAMMEQIAHAQVGRFKKLIRLIFSGGTKKPKGRLWEIAVPFYGEVKKFGDIDNKNLYNNPQDTANKTIFNEAQNGVIRKEGPPLKIDPMFYGSEKERQKVLRNEFEMVEANLQDRLEKAKRIESGEPPDVQALNLDVENIIQALAWDPHVMGPPVMVGDTASLQATK